MVNDSGVGAVMRELERVAGLQPPGTRLPSMRQLQQRFHVSALTVQRALSTLASRGLLVTRPGSGTFTAAGRPQPRTGDMNWQTLALGSRPSLGAEMEDLLAPSPPGLHPLASAFLDESLQPLGLLAAAAARAARRPRGWTRPPPDGVEELRSYLADELSPAYTADHVLVTAGGQAALAATCRYLASPGDPIVIESPTYIGALAAARAAGLVAVPVPVDQHGVLPDALADALTRSRARLVYLQPRHANPTGATLAVDRRKAVMQAVQRAGAFLVEDDWVRDLDIDGPTPPPLAALDEDGHVVYIRSLTKPVAAGLRVAALVARGPALTRLRRGRLADDLFVAPILQHTALEVLTAPGWNRHLAGLRRALRLRRDTLIGAVRRDLPDCELHLVPTGGAHLWVRLPDGSDEAAIVAAAHRQGIAVSPGSNYFPGEPAGPYLRLSYAATQPQTLADAIATLADVIHEAKSA